MGMSATFWSGELFDSAGAECKKVAETIPTRRMDDALRRQILLRVRRCIGPYHPVHFNDTPSIVGSALATLEPTRFGQAARALLQGQGVPYRSRRLPGRVTSA